MERHDTCHHCGHPRSRHNRPEPGNPQPGGDRCAKGCVCAFFKEHDGRPAWARMESEEFVQHHDVHDDEEEVE